MLLSMMMNRRCQRNNLGSYSVDDDKGRVSDDLEETRFDDVEKKTQVSDDVEETRRDDVEKNSKVSDDVAGKRKS